MTIPRDRWDDVRIRLARAEAEAAERGLALADARLALRALTAGPISPSDEPGATHAPPVTPLDASPQHPPLSLQGTRGVAERSPGMVPAPGPEDGGAPDAAHWDPAAAVAEVPAEGLGGPTTIGAGPVPGDVVAARNLAARTGGYVPAVPAPVKKRRWWQSR